MGLVDNFFADLTSSYQEVGNVIPITYKELISVFIFAILIALYAILTWKFYRYLSKKDLIKLNLQKYNTSTHPIVSRFFGSILYLIEYIIILPFLIFFWFAILALIILILSEGAEINRVIIIAAAMVGAIRMLAYYTEDLSKDLAKMFPFTVLTIFILTPRFFSASRVTENLAQIPSLLTNILYFLVLIMAIEFILRIIETIIGFFKDDEIPETEQQATSQKK